MCPGDGANEKVQKVCKHRYGAVNAVVRKATEARPIELPPDRAFIGVG